MIIGKLPFYQTWKTRYAIHWKRRRFDRIMALPDLPEDQPLKILEVGCANGKDFVQFLAGTPHDVWGLDLVDSRIQQENFHFVQGDAAALPFEDKSFDLVVSVGLLEHIEPMEKLCQVIEEFDRVGVHQVTVIPSASTFLEPHCGRLRFPMKLERTMLRDQPDQPLHLNFLSDHTWTKFQGFGDCDVTRFYYLPPLIKNTVVYR